MWKVNDDGRAMDNALAFGLGALKIFIICKSSNSQVENEAEFTANLQVIKKCLDNPFL